MKKPETKGLKIGSGTPISAIGSLSAATGRAIPPNKPPRQQFMDKNVRLAKLLKLKEIAYWLGTQVVWEFGKQWLFGRKCQSTQS